MGFTPTTTEREIISPCSKLSSAAVDMLMVVRYVSLGKRRCCSCASTPVVPAGDDSSVLRSGSILPSIFSSSQTCTRSKIPLHSRNRTWLRQSLCRRSSRGKIVLWRRLWRQEFLPQSVYLCPYTLSNCLRGGRPPRFKTYFDFGVFRVIDRTHTPLNPALPLSYYLAPVETIVSSPGCKIF